MCKGGDQPGPVAGVAAQLALHMPFQRRFFGEVVIPKEQGERIKQPFTWITAGEGVEPGL